VVLVDPVVVGGKQLTVNCMYEEPFTATANARRAKNCFLGKKGKHKLFKFLSCLENLILKIKKHTNWMILINPSGSLSTSKRAVSTV
jgi:hypothetical protein